MDSKRVKVLVSVIFGGKLVDISANYHDFSPEWHETSECAITISEILGTLTSRESRIIMLRFGIEDGVCKSFSDIGKEFNVTPERIRQIEYKALLRLRHPSRTRKLKALLQNGLVSRIAFARRDLYIKLVKLYPDKVAFTVAIQVKENDLRAAFKSTESALKSSCGNNISWCLVCGKPLPPGWTLCSNECKVKYKTLSLVCDTCGKEVIRWERELFRRKNGERVGKQAVFCNRECMYHRPKGIYTYVRSKKE